jgi:Mrp family chromosome partitioning ATPase
MTLPTVDQIQQALAQVMDPELGRSIVELGMVRDIQIQEGEVAITLVLTTPACPLRNQIKAQVEAAAEAVPGVKNVSVELGAMSDEERRRALSSKSPASQLNKIGRVVAVISGKGGVGKSSVTALLAASLQRQGYSVGVLDADLTGPSIPRLFGITGPVQGVPLGILPVETRTGIKVISTNLMLPDENMAITWRGSIMSRAIRQFWEDVLWGSLDYLLVDLPPGTSDATLTVMQSLPLDGIVLVTMPQRLATMVVRKTVDMACNMQVPIFGIVENMAYYPCLESGVKHEIFGQSHADEVAQAAGAPILGRLPIDPDLAALGDSGEIEHYEPVEFVQLVEAFTAAVSVLDPASLEPEAAD